MNKKGITALHMALADGKEEWREQHTSWVMAKSNKQWQKVYEKRKKVWDNEKS